MATGTGLSVSPPGEIGWDSASVKRRKHQPPGQRAATQDFTQAYEAYAGLILRYCNARMGNLAEAEDATATVFSQALSAWPPNDPAAVRSWLFAIAHNVVASHYRSGYGAHPPRPLDAAHEVTDHAVSPEDRAIQRDERARLLAAVDALGTEQRQVVNLRLAGLTGPEIADAMGKSHAAVKMLQHRAVQNLKSILILAEEDPRALRGIPGKDATHEI
ncbi:MAG: sigma-70 family RNA polymerase sigma factor [Thermomicrobiales bacterium]|nr:sigma-70 family RNA polymerase sigma factor [Thermomicrobiales bacterium]